MPLSRLVLAALATAALHAADAPAEPAVEPHAWPQFGYDAGCTCATPGGLASPLVLRWQWLRKAPMAAVAHIAAREDRVVVEGLGDKNHDAKIGDPANNPYLIGLDAATGRPAWEWSHKHDWAWGCPIALAGDRCWFNDDGFGSCTWHDGTAEGLGGGADSWGYVNVDAQAGLVLRGCALKVDNDGTGVFAHGLDGGQKWAALHEDGARMAVEMTTCAFAQGCGMAFVSAAWIRKPEGKHQDGLYGLNQADGSEAWFREGAWGGVSCDGTHAYATGGEKGAAKLHCLDPATGKDAWSLACGEIASHPPALGRGVCVVVTDGGAIAGIATDGDKPGHALWQQATDAPFAADERGAKHAVVAIALGAGKNGAVAILTRRSVRILDLRHGTPIAELPLDPKLGKPRDPLIVDGCLIVAGAEGVLCFGGKEKPKAK
jgi:hypothetical protein